jgi:hypothetical protein
MSSEVQSAACGVVQLYPFGTAVGYVFINEDITSARGGSQKPTRYKKNREEGEEGGYASQRGVRHKLNAPLKIRMLADELLDCFSVLTRVTKQLKLG